MAEVERCDLARLTQEVQADHRRLASEMRAHCRRLEHQIRTQKFEMARVDRDGVARDRHLRSLAVQFVLVCLLIAEISAVMGIALHRP